MCCFQGLPCHLYFDLEFSRKENAERDGDEMVDLLISIIFEAFNDKYSIQGNHKWILELDSSTDGMFYLSFTSEKCFLKVFEVLWVYDKISEFYVNKGHELL